MGDLISSCDLLANFKIKICDLSGTKSSEIGRTIWVGLSMSTTHEKDSIVFYRAEKIERVGALPTTNQNHQNTF